MIETGLLFGSFNPIHVGHLMLAQYALNFGGVDEVWIVVSPHNPFKQQRDLADAEHRCEMARIATKDSDNIKVCDVELHLPLPSYTIQTMTRLKEDYPDRRFSIIMGGDNVEGLPRWREANRLLSGQRFLIYPRPGYSPNPEQVTKMGATVEMLDAPQVDISSTMIREWTKNSIETRYFVANGVAEYIAQNGLYK